MQIMNSGATMAALGELKKNDTTLGKELKKVASGMKVNSAGDGASEYAISEKMRVRLRSLDQDIENVQTGKNLVRTAEGGIQEIVNNLRSMKSFHVVANEYTYVTNDDGKVVAAFIGNLSTTAQTSNMVIGIVSADKGKVKIGDDYFNKYSVVNNKETYTVQIQDGAANDTLTKGNVVAFAPSSDNQYDDNTGFVVLSAAATYDSDPKTIDGTAYTVSTVYVKEYNESDKTLSYYSAVQGKKADGTDTSNADEIAYYVGSGDLKTAGVDDDVVIYYVNADDDKAGDEIGVNEFNAQTGYANAIILVNSDSAVEYIVVETSDEANIFA